MSNGSPAEGSLVKIGTAPAIFLIILSQACLIPDPNTGQGLFGAKWISQPVSALNLPSDRHSRRALVWCKRQGRRRSISIHGGWHSRSPIRT